jgi:hypothetical protein
MPIDPNIALGIRPIEQPNMLAQAGQFMQLRQMQQENDTQNALRDFYAKGGDMSNPEGLRQLRMINPKLVDELQYKQAQTKNLESEISSRNIGTVEKTLGVASRQLQGVTDENGFVNWTLSQFKDPVLKAHFDKVGVTPEDAVARARADVAKNGLGAAIDASAMGMEKFRTQLRQEVQGTKVANIGAAAPLQQAALAREKYADELANPKLTPVQGMMPIPDPNAPGGVRMVETFAGFNPRGGGITPSQVRAPAAAPTVTNSLATQYPAPAVNNALNPNFVTAPSSPVVPSAAANVPNVSAVAPSVALPNTPAQAAMFAPKPSAQQEKQAQVEVERVKGKNEVADVIGSLASKYTDLAKTGGMTSTKKGALENIGAYLSSTTAGQELGKMTATQEQSLRNEIKAQSPILLEGIKKATGMTAKELDSNADVKRWMEAMGSPTFDIQSTLGILKSLNKQFGSGGEISAPPTAPTKSTGGFKYIGPVKE